MGKVRVLIHNGKITVQGAGYKGSACDNPINKVLGALGGDVTSNLLTEEGALPDEPVTHSQNEEQLA
jgi:hypothetical protein